MRKNSLFFLVTLVLLSNVLPVFAEVAEIQIDKDSYFKGDSINVKGTVDSDASGLVTIVLRDPYDKFVLLSQAFIQPDDSFEKTIAVNEKFQVPGTYNATAFVLNMTAGKTQSFDFDTMTAVEIEDSSDEIFSNDVEIESMINEEPKIINTNLEPKLNTLDNHVEEEFVKEKQKNELTGKSQIADFVDTSKNPKYYLDRYYNEPTYQAWFDKNYPNLTIEEAVGYFTPTETEIESHPNNAGAEIIPQAEAISVGSSTPSYENDGDIAQIVLVLGGLAVLFGAVYGIKKKVDGNTRHISLNRDIIKRKIISPIIDSNPIGIIQTRLAKGEISIDEYEKLKQKLDKNSR